MYNLQNWNEIISCVEMAYTGPSEWALKFQMSGYNTEFDPSKVIRHLRPPSAQRDFDKVQGISLGNSIIKVPHVTKCFGFKISISKQNWVLSWFAPQNRRKQCAGNNSGTEHRFARASNHPVEWIAQRLVELLAAPESFLARAGEGSLERDGFLACSLPGSGLVRSSGLWTSGPRLARVDLAASWACPLQKSLPFLPISGPISFPFSSIILLTQPWASLSFKQNSIQPQALPSIPFTNMIQKQIIIIGNTEFKMHFQYPRNPQLTIKSMML